MQEYNLAIASDWEYDQDFINLLEFIAHRHNLSTYVIWPSNLNETIQLIQNEDIKFNYLLDRASDTSQDFIKLQDLLKTKNVPILDRWEKLKWAADKANMHKIFSFVGIPVPQTIILSPYSVDNDINISEFELKDIGIPFIVKPAVTAGGGAGVVKNAETLEDIFKARQEFPHSCYLVQKRVIPLEKDEKRFWFRGFHSCGLIKAVWWNDLIHVYEIITDEDIERYELFPIFEIVSQMARTCGVNFFSTEIAVNMKGEFMVIDYINEVCDMRLKSKFIDGVPDDLVRQISEQIVSYVLKR